MKIIRLLMFLAAILFVTTFVAGIAKASPVPEDGIPHLDIEMSSAEYAPYLKKSSKAEDEPSIAEALRLGQRLSNWLKSENEKRPADQQLRLTSQGTRTGVPIETPSQYNPTIIQTKYEAVLAEMPESMREVLNFRVPYPATLPVDDATFVTLGRKLDRVYQSAARWKTLKSYMSYYIGAKARDVRGFYYLRKNGWTAEKLQGFTSLDTDTQSQLKSWLVLICMNSGISEAACSSTLTQAVSRNTVSDYFKNYNLYGQQTWDDFFVIPNGGQRADIVWNSNQPGLATIPFNTPSNARIQSYLSVNIEDEWKWDGWNLKLLFGNYPEGPHVEFQTGVVPHVNGIGGNIITMDENQSLEEYESQWTIRHEFGHVLGFPDCYHEFYDVSSASFINYQLDTSDLMCSRAGNMKERLFKEMKRVYFKP